MCVLGGWVSLFSDCLVLSCFVGSSKWPSFLSVHCQHSKGHLPLPRSLLSQKQHSPETALWFCMLARHLLCILNNSPNPVLEWLRMTLSRSPPAPGTLPQPLLFLGYRWLSFDGISGAHSAGFNICFSTCIEMEIDNIFFYFLVFTRHDNWFSFHLISFSLLCFLICMDFVWRVAWFGFV